MKIKFLIFFTATVLIEGIISLVTMLGMKLDPGRGHVFNYSSLKWELVAIVTLLMLVLLAGSILVPQDRLETSSIFFSGHAIGRP